MDFKPFCDGKIYITSILSKCIKISILRGETLVITLGGCLWLKII